MHISFVTLYVGDVDRAVAFYTQKLGWTKTMDEPMGPDMRWVTVAPPGERTAFTLMKDASKIADMSGVVIEVDDAERAHAQLASAGVEFTAAPQRMPWGMWAMFRDSEGNVHGLHSP